MKLTLLDMTQKVLESIGSDKVSDISETEEALEVSYLIRDVFFEMITDYDRPHLMRSLTVTNVGDTARPTLLTLPDNVLTIKTDTAYYDCRETVAGDPVLTNLQYLDLDEFISMFAHRSASLSESNVQEMTENVKFYILNDTAPKYYTLLNETTIVMDAFNSAVENTVQQSKFQIVGYVEPTWTHTNTAVPDLPSREFPEFLAECKSVAAVQIAQEANPKEEQRSRRGRIINARHKRGRAKRWPLTKFGR